jgi:hypothetical protein
MNDLLLPQIDEDSAPFWEGTRNGELRLQRCPQTGRLIFPPRPVSPWGRGAEPVTPEWTTVSGRGEIWSFAVPHPPLLPQFSALAPYNVIVVALDEDPTVRIVGNLVSRAGAPINEIDPASIQIGEAVQAVFDAVSDEIALPRWVRLSSLEP